MDLVFMVRNFVKSIHFNEYTNARVLILACYFILYLRCTCTNSMEMLTEDLLKLFVRDLNRLKREISQYQDEANLWKVDGSISNSAGNLCLHLIGNLQTYFGSVYGNTGYVRNRDKEFSDKAVPRVQLMDMIAQTELMMQQVLPKISQEQLEEDYPMEVFDHSMKSAYYFVHLAVHLGYHLGQINYHRRLLDN